MKRLWFAVVLLVLFSIYAFGQTQNGQISGTIRDATGAVVSGAKVTAKSVNTGFTRETTTNASGIYTVPSLKPDTYDVTVEASGFRKYARRVEVAVGSQNEVSAELAVGATATTVEVSALGEAVNVNTETQTLSQVITSEDLKDFPTDATRNPYALVGSATGVTEDTASNRGAGYSINGQRSSSTSILLDGAENVDLFTASVGQIIPLDSVQEFSVMTSNFTAEFGRASGGVVNLVTKSGSNQLHGSAYEFNRISHLSSNTYQNDASDTPKGVFTRNDFGFSLGGPIKKSKLFFFNNTEWIRVRSAAPQFFTILDPSSYASLAPVSQAFFTQFGKLSSGVHTVNTTPCGPLTCDVVAFTVPSDAGGGYPQNTWEEVAKVDYNLSDKTTITGRYAAYHELDFAGTISSSPYAGYNTGANQFDQNYTLSISHLFSSNVVDTAKVVYNRLLGPVDTLGTAPIGPTLYTDSSLPSVSGFPLAFPGYLPVGPGEAIPFGGPQNLYQFYDDFSLAKGKHQFKAGFQYIHVRDNRVFGAYETAVEYLGSSLTSGLANLVSGNIYQFQGAIYPQGEYPCPKNLAGVTQVSPACTLQLPVGPPDFERNYHYNDFAVYGQDSWKVTPHFTANLGLRWEYYGVQHNANTALDSNFVMGSGSTIFDQIRNGSVQLAKDGGVFWKPYYHAFGPRVGFAWDVFGDGKTSLRGGYSIGYERNFGNVTFNAIQNPPNYGVVSLTAGVDIPSMPVYTDNAGPLAGSGITKPFPAVSQRAINQNMKPAYAETWDLAIERQITHNSIFSIAYSGSHGIHLYDISNINLAGEGGTYLGDARAANRLNLQYSNMNYRSDNGYSHYNSLGVAWRASNLWSKGVDLSTNYTWSHSLDNLSSTFSDSNNAQASGLYALGYLDSFNPSLNYGNSDFDIRHRFRVDGSWELPWMKSASSGIARAVLGGWGLGANFNLRSGAPFSIYDGTNFNGQDYPLYVPPVAIAHSGSAVSAGPNFAPNTFNYITLPNTGGVPNNLGDSLGLPNCTGLDHVGCTYTVSGLPYPERNQFYGPRYWNVSANFFKNFKVTERFGLQFRAEMYNLFNHHNTYVATTNIDASSLFDLNGNQVPYIQAEKGGPWGYTGTPSDERRNVQLGLKLTF
ncbi:MAG TPA: TonB-dependent receptor [Terriglobales bacterium]|nr:TonB-dependent receptor [Terriglobales bacterium]